MRQIPMLESLTVEFKSDVGGYSDRDLVEAVVGMANSDGGVLYLGVEDDGKITGVSEKHSDAIGVAALIANLTVPPISVRAGMMQEMSMAVLKIEIPKSMGIVSTRSGKTLRRRLKADGMPETIPMYCYEFSSRLSDLGLLDLSAQPLPDATMEDLDPNQRVRLRRIIETQQGGDKSLLDLSEPELDTALRLVAISGGVRVPTLAGMLLLGKEERIAELVPTAKTTFRVLEGTQVRVNEECSKPLLEVIEMYETYLKAWNPERETEDGFIRVPIPEFDSSAFREGLVNALCHRDYMKLGRVRVLIDDERLEISNPGGFVDGVSMDNLLKAAPRERNPALAEALKRIGLAEKTGRGIDRIFEGSIIFGRPWPDYSESTSSMVTLSIRRAKADISFMKLIYQERGRRGQNLSISELMVLSALKREGRANEEKLIAVTKLCRAAVCPAIEKMLGIGLIEVCGKAANQCTYTIRQMEYPSHRKTVQYVRESANNRIRYPERILALAARQNGTVTKQEVVNLLQISNSYAYTLLKQLQKDGKLELVQSGRYAVYRVFNS